MAKCIANASLPLDTSPLTAARLPVFVVGDFNARHSSWDPSMDFKTTEPRGEWVHKNFSAPTAQALHPRLPRLTLLNNHFTNTRQVATHYSEDNDTVIDLALCTSHHVNMLHDMNVLTGATIATDHFPLLLSFRSVSEIRVDQPSVHIPPPHPSTGVSDEEMESKYDLDHTDSKSSSDTPGTDPPPLPY